MAFFLSSFGRRQRSRRIKSWYFVLVGSVVALNIYPLHSQAEPSVVDLLPQPLQDALQQNPSAQPTAPKKEPAPSEATRGTQPAPPVIPTIPGLPALELPSTLPAPTDILPPAPLPEASSLIDLSPPAPLNIPPTAANTYWIAIDKVHLQKHVKFSLIEIATAAGAKPAIRIDADRAVLDNLRVQFPGQREGIGNHIKGSAPGHISTLEGNFHIIVHGLDVKAGTKDAGLIPLKIDASMAPEQIKAQLLTMGLGTPDAISDQLYMHNVKLDTYFVSSDKLILGPENTISPE